MNRTTLVLGAALSLAGCSSPSLTASDSFADRYVGSWRANLTTASFSDYVFAKDGALTTLRSVVNDVSVDEMQGAGLVHNPATGVSCAFGADWYSEDASTVVVGGTCTDALARDIVLDFGDGTSALSQVTVHSVAGEISWMEPIGWSFRRCDLHQCD